jgi:DNA-binding SARP family transcriptional activator/tetratricopeptide (TPR) repeat protein
MEFKVLGPLVVVGDDGSVIALPSAAQRRLASILAMRAGTIVSADLLADHLQLSAGALRTSVTRLRRLVGQDVLATAAPGYELRTDNVDARRFEALLSEARSSRGNAAKAALESANSLWFGGADGAYVEFAQEPWAIGEVTRLEELRAGGVEDLAELLLGSQEWSQCIAHLEKLIEAQPFRDRPRRLLMEVLARSGRRTDALRAYQSYRRLLLDEVGVEPSAAVVALDRAIAQEELDMTPPFGTMDAGTQKQIVADSRKTIPPLPNRLARVAKGGFAGRVVERMMLRRQFREVASGERRVALLSGEPGIGKTMLACTAAASFYDEGAIVLLGRCDEDISVPYQPWIEALEHLVRNIEQSLLDSVGRRHLVELGGLVPAVYDRCPHIEIREPSDPDADRFMLFASVCALLEAASAECPLVLVFDDVHWADTPTLLMLRHVVQSSAQLRLHVLVTYRDGRIEPSSALADLLGFLSREDFVERLPITGLLDAEIVELIENTAERSLDLAGVALARELRRETDGNPFFVGELLRHLAEAGAFAAGDSASRLTTDALRVVELPETVRDVIRQRVVRLGLSTQHVLRMAAVVGREFDVEVVAAVSETSTIDVIEILERAEFASLVHEISDGSGRYTFTHALIDQTLYKDLGTARSRIAHRQIGETLERLRSDGGEVRISELAYHWMAGGKPGDWLKIVNYAREVGDAAVAALAPDEAARWYGNALTLLDRQPNPDPRLRAELLVELGTTQLKDGEQLLLEAAQIALREGDNEMLIRAVLADRRGWQSHLGSVDHQRLALVEAALVAAGPDDTRERARLLKGYATDLAYTGDPARCLRLDQEAAEIARRLGDSETLLRMLIRRPVGFWAPDSLDYRLAASREATVLAEAGSDLSSIFWANNDLTVVAGEVGSRAEFDRAAERIKAISEVLVQQPGFDWLISAFFYINAMLTADLDAAERFAHLTASQATNAGNRNVDALVSVLLANVWFQKGDERAAIPLLREVVARSSRLDSNRALLARAHYNAGDRSAAAQMVDSEFAQGFPAAWDKYWKVATCYWSEATALVGHQPAAALLYERLLPWSTQITFLNQNVESAVDFYLGLLAAVCHTPEIADQHFERALKLNEALGSPFQIARTKLEWGRLLLRTGYRDTRRAYDLCTATSEISTTFGFRRLEAESLVLVDSLGKAAVNS